MRSHKDHLIHLSYVFVQATLPTTLRYLAAATKPSLAAWHHFTAPTVGLRHRLRFENTATASLFAKMTNANGNTSHDLPEVTEHPIVMW
jgi:hypothetical protein